MTTEQRQEQWAYRAREMFLFPAQNRRPEEAGRTLLLDTSEESQPYGQLSLRLLAFRLRKRAWVLF